MSDKNSKNSSAITDEYQEVAIHQKGSVILEAGAGAGKTFVLIEHIIMLLSDLWKTQKNSIGGNSILLQKTVREYLSSIVLMTFTIKATAEMQIRLIKRVETEVALATEDNKRDKEFWEVVLSLLNEMTVSTIHSFCLKLIYQGNILDISPEEEIINDSESYFKIKRIIEAWFRIKFAGEVKENKFFIDYLILHFEVLVDTVKEIFDRPYLRYLWSQNKTTITGESFFKRLGDHSPIKDFFSSSGNGSNYGEQEFVVPEKYASKNWGQFFLALLTLRKNGFNSFSDWQNWINFFESIERLPASPKSDDCANIIAFWPNIKALREFLRKYNDAVYTYYNADEETLNLYHAVIKDLFTFVEENYFMFSGITFSDLEYILLKQMESPTFFTNVQSNYKYFIVDEFQDVSLSQFMLIKQMIGNDFNRIFAVGDIKQAIYGFRGGEVDVFLQLQTLVSQVLYLVNNYRSHAKIVEYNNVFFDFIFKRGINFSGDEKLPIKWVAQNAFHKDRLGAIYKVNVELKNYKEHKINSTEMNHLEAHAIHEHIMKLLQMAKAKGPNENHECEIAVLYKNLGPIRFLVPLLLKSETPFLAQIKISYAELPLFVIFRYLLQLYLSPDRENQIKDTAEIIKSLLSCASLSIEDIPVTKIHSFLQDVALFNIITAYNRFIYSLSLAGSYYHLDLELITKLYYSLHGDLFRLCSELKQMEENTLSFDYQWGENPEVKIMSAHSAKGLQFDHVIMGGIFTNGYEPPDITLIGKNPGSFFWSSKIERKRYPSPEAILEVLEDRHKNFAESKRLFYVTCTRAKKSLSWINLPYDIIDFKHHKNSWIEGLFVFIQHHLDHTFYEETKVVIDLEKIEKNGSSKLPLYFTDNMGLQFKSPSKSPPDNSDAPCLGTISELAVTDLSALALCPYKFYLQNICDLQKEMDDLAPFLPAIPTIPSSSTASSLGSHIHSSKERGDRIHRLVAKIGKGNLKINEILSGLNGRVEEEDRQAVNYAFHLLQDQRKRYLFIIEELIKFPLFGVMVTGAPDIILKPIYPDDIFEIWDFKTGHKEGDSQKGYHLQLLCYAWASYELGLCPREKTQKLSLVYLDEQEIIHYHYNFEEIENMLYLYWQTLADLSYQEKAHCGSCEYRIICQGVNHLRPEISDSGVGINF